MYAYQHDCPFEAFITNLGKYNEGELVGEWVKFPTTDEQLDKVLRRIGIGEEDDSGQIDEEWFISDYDIYVPHLKASFLGEYVDLKTLNNLAIKIDSLKMEDYQLFQAALQMKEMCDIKDLLQLLKELNRYCLLPVKDEEDLGICYIETIYANELNDLFPYIDFDQLGKDLAMEEDGTFTDQGYVRYS